MKKSRGILVLILTAIVTVFFCYTAAVGIGPTGTGAMKNIKTGLDLAGGVSITYQAKDSNPSSEDMSDTVYKLQKRVEQYSTEAQVYQEGSDRINVEIPGVTDANAILEELGQPGSLCFITQQDDDGNANFQADSSSETGYSLARSLDEIRAAGSVVLEGTDVADATGGAIQQQNSSSREYVVDLTLTDEGKTKFAEATQNNVGKQIANQVYLAQGEYSKVIGRSESILAMCQALHYDLVALHVQIQLLAANWKLGKTEQALELLRGSLSQAFPDGILMPFVENYPYIEELLKGSFFGINENFLFRITRMGKEWEMRCDQLKKEEAYPPVFKVLSDRELEITELMAKHMSNKEIAQSLFLSEGTVKQYINQIYSKLQIPGDVRVKRKYLLEMMEGKS